MEPQIDPELTDIISEEDIPEYKNSHRTVVLPWVIVISVIFTGGIWGLFRLINKSGATPRSIPVQPSETLPSTTPSDFESSSVSSTISSTATQNRIYQVPSNWKKFTDSSAGITYWHPPEYSAKLNSNRGIGFDSFDAGSYVLDANQRKILIAYFFPYSTGSRRQAFYNALLENPGSGTGYTVSSGDLILNDRTFLKLVMNYGAWLDASQAQKRAFLLTDAGGRIYYFTYPSDIENDRSQFDKILTLIATSSLTGEPLNSTGGPGATAECFPRPGSLNKGTAWDSKLDSEGNMVVIIRSTQLLRVKPVDYAYIEVGENSQNNPPIADLPVSGYTLAVDTSQKMNYQDALQLTIPKYTVDRLKTRTPAQIQSLAVYLNINGSVETSEGISCAYSDTYSYYVSK